jgi:CRISPR-associated protein Cmr5
MALKSQRMAQAAHGRVEGHQRSKKAAYQKEYRSFAREFPTLVHQCGLAQAVAFAQAKGGHQADYLADLGAVLAATGHNEAAAPAALAAQTRSLRVSGYVRLSRDALDAAVWIKRYVEALFEDPRPEGGQT